MGTDLDVHQDNKVLVEKVQLASLPLGLLLAVEGSGHNLVPLGLGLAELEPVEPVGAVGFINP